MPYLIDAGPFLVEVSDVRAELGLKTDRLDPVIAAFITSECLNVNMLKGVYPIRRETWMERPENVGKRREPTKAGPVYVGRVGHADAGFWRDCTYEPTASEIAAARQRVVSRLRRSVDVFEALRAELTDDDARLAVEAA